MKTIQTAKRVVTVRWIFRDLSRACSFAYGPGSNKNSTVVMGDAGEYWVVSMADAARLEKVGYEFAPIVSF